MNLKASKYHWRVSLQSLIYMMFQLLAAITIFSSWHYIEYYLISGILIGLQFGRKYKLLAKY